MQQVREVLLACRANRGLVLYVLIVFYLFGWLLVSPSFHAAVRTSEWILRCN
jgi:hypothetical protein